MPDAALATDRTHYPGGRAEFDWSHWRCCLDIGRSPASCNQVPYDPFAIREGNYDIGPEGTAAAVRADLTSALARLARNQQWCKEFVRAAIDLGPQDDDERTDDWLARHEYHWWDFAVRRNRTISWADARRRETFRVLSRLVGGRIAG